MRVDERWSREREEDGRGLGKSCRAQSRGVKRTRVDVAVREPQLFRLR